MTARSDTDDGEPGHAYRYVGLSDLTATRGVEYDKLGPNVRFEQAAPSPSTPTASCAADSI